MNKLKFDFQRAVITYTLFIAYPIAQTLRSLAFVTFSDAFMFDLRVAFWVALVSLLGEEVFKNAINIFYAAKNKTQ